MSVGGHLLSKSGLRTGYFCSYGALISMSIKSSLFLDRMKRTEAKSTAKIRVRPLEVAPRSLSKVQLAVSRFALASLIYLFTIGQKQNHFSFGNFIYL